MSKTTTAGIQSVERRLHTRHRARTTVYITTPTGRKKLCRAINLSATGVFVETTNLGLAQGTAGRARVRHQSRRRHQAASSHRGGRACLARRHRPDDGRLHRALTFLTFPRTPAFLHRGAGVFVWSRPLEISPAPRRGNFSRLADRGDSNESSATGGDASKLCTKSTPSAVSQLL